MIVGVCHCDLITVHCATGSLLPVYRRHLMTLLVREWYRSLWPEHELVQQTHFTASWGSMIVVTLGVLLSNMLGIHKTAKACGQVYGM